MTSQPAASALASAPADDRDRDEACLAMLSPLLRIGATMVACGGDVHNVERILGRVGAAYDARDINVLVITAMILVTVELPSGLVHTQSQRIEGASATDFEKLEALSQLCIRCSKEPLSAQELQEQYEAINKKPIGNIALYIGGILSTSSFAVFFGGGWIDALFSALIAIFVCFTMRRWKCYLPNNLIYNFVAALSAGLLVGIASFLVPGLSQDYVIIGVIMILIPGVAMTNSLRDLIAGDTISGVMRLVESLLWAIALALGFMLALYLTGLVM